VIAAQSWWSSFGLAGHRDWTFLQFSAVLLQMTLLYMMCGLVLPDIPTEAPVDLREHFYRERQPFFGAFTLMLATSVAKDWIMQGHLPSKENLAFHGIFASLSIAGLLTRRPLFHQIATPIGALLVATYIALLFARLA